MYHVSAQGVDECMINVHYYYYYNSNHRTIPHEKLQAHGSVHLFFLNPKKIKKSQHSIKRTTLQKLQTHSLLYLYIIIIYMMYFTNIQQCSNIPHTHISLSLSLTHTHTHTHTHTTGTFWGCLRSLQITDKTAGIVFYIYSISLHATLKYASLSF